MANRRDRAGQPGRDARTLNIVMGCAFAIALLVVIGLIAYLWTL